RWKIEAIVDEPHGLAEEGAGRDRLRERIAIVETEGGPVRPGPGGAGSLAHLAVVLVLGPDRHEERDRREPRALADQRARGVEHLRLVPRGERVSYFEDVVAR